MHNCLRRLWLDDQGAMIATEWLIFATIPVMGIVAGLTSLRNSVNSELTQFGNSVQALQQPVGNQGSTVSTGVNGLGAAVAAPSFRGSATMMGPMTAPPVTADLPAF